MNLQFSQIPHYCSETTLSSSQKAKRGHSWWPQHLKCLIWPTYFTTMIKQKRERLNYSDNKKERKTSESVILEQKIKDIYFEMHLQYFVKIQANIHKRSHNSKSSKRQYTNVIIAFFNQNLTPISYIQEAKEHCKCRQNTPLKHANHPYHLYSKIILTVPNANLIMYKLKVMPTLPAA